MTDLSEPHVAEARSAESVTQAGDVVSARPVGQSATPARSLRLQSVSYSAGVCHVKRVDATLNAGCTAALCGPVGSGKTTLLRVVAGTQAVDSGSVFFGDRDVTAFAPEDRNLAWVPQGGGLLPGLTVRQQLELPLISGRLSGSAAAIVAERWQIAHLLDRHPERLSGGERLLVALARATIVRPVGLLLDEPFSALSDSQRERAAETLADWRQEGPPVWIVHVSHQVEFVDRPHVFWRLEEGRLEATEL